jgi:hypothetical protein
MVKNKGLELGWSQGRGVKVRRGGYIGELLKGKSGLDQEIDRGGFQLNIVFLLGDNISILSMVK